MSKPSLQLFGGILLGAFAVIAVQHFLPDAQPPPIESPPAGGLLATESDAVVREHRERHFTTIASIEGVMALPSAFARSEATYVIAGRSDAVRTQQLIFDTLRVADEAERTALLTIFFTRLTELDPRSALSLARTEPYVQTRSLERSVWHAWAHADFEDALFAAKTETSTGTKRFVAQSLYEAFGFLGNEITDRIEAELGIEPDDRTRALYLYRIADRSPAEAIAFVNAMEGDDQQNNYISWLANYLARQDPEAALALADQLQSESMRQHFTGIIRQGMARENPRDTIERWLAGDSRQRSSGALWTAARELAKTDLDGLTLYFESARSSDQRRAIGVAIARHMAKSDPAAAIAWAREHDRGDYPAILTSVLREIGSRDPELALAEIIKTTNSSERSNLIRNTVMSIARNDAVAATQMVDQIENEGDRMQARSALLHAWLESDPDAAVAWITTHDKETVGELVQSTSYRLLEHDIDTAIRLLPAMPESQQASWRLQIAQHLAVVGSPGEAQSFVQQYRDQPDFENLQASLITGLARRDVLTAKNLADQLADAEARDRAYMHIVAERASTHPHEARAWLRSITGEQNRATAAGMLASTWYRNDPDPAVEWIRGLPNGNVRDDAVHNVAGQWRGEHAELEKLIELIDDRGKRGQAKIMLIYRVMRTNPDRAREMLDDPDIPSYQRQRLESSLYQIRIRY